MPAFGLIPDDAKQALRTRRFLIAAGTSQLAVLALFLGAWLNLYPPGAALRSTAGILVTLLAFYAVFRSGLNLRFRDPSLTTEQIGATILLLAWIMYHVPAARDPLSLFYPAAFLFGVLRLDTMRLIALALLALAAHITMLLLSLQRDPQMDLKAAGIQLAVLFVMLPWFAMMGGYVSRLREQLAESNRRLTEAVERVGQIAMRDELTGVYNRRFLIETLQREVARASRLGSPLSVCLFDLDHFKRINDGFGHAAGDAVLKRFTEIARVGLRGVDVLGRQGGEEFVLILPDTKLDGAAGCAERIRANVEREDFPLIPAAHRVTVTGGVTCSLHADSVDTLLARADRALYEGKEAGRNRVVTAE